MKAIIFGANGQDGYFLNIFLKLKNIEVLKVSRKGDCIIGDVSDQYFVRALIDKYKPNYIFHFAAVSSTKHNVLFENFQAICQGTNNILESVRLHSPSSRVFLSGSAMQFNNNSQPINENTPFKASSPYAVQRIYSTYLARYYRELFDLKIFVGYLFNHDSERRSEEHINQKIINAVKRISKGSNERIEIGNINVMKEFNYAGDIIEAIWIFINQDSIYEVVLGSGVAYSLGDWLKCCFDLIGKNWEDFLIIDDKFIPEYKILVSDPKLIFNLGWKPKLNIADLAKIMLYN